MNTEKLKVLAVDLRRQPPPSPHEKLGGHVIAARTLAKCRASLAGVNGEYNFHPCGLSAFLWKFTGITPEQFKDFVATGASDDEVAAAAAGITRVMLPARNRRDYDDIPEEVRNTLEFIWLEKVDDAVAQALTPDAPDESEEG